MKQAVIAPFMLSLLYPLDEQVAGYPRDRWSMVSGESIFCF